MPIGMQTRHQQKRRSTALETRLSGKRRKDFACTEARRAKTVSERLRLNR
jgi:hypothetical protein